MPLVAPENVHLANYRRSQFGGGDWLQRIRQAGIDRFAEVGFPDPNDEAWRWTNLAPITRTAFALGERDIVSRSSLAGLTFGDGMSAELVFINGYFAPQFSQLSALPEGVLVSDLQSQIEGQSPVLQQHLGRHALVGRNPFVALNSGFIAHGAVIHVGRNVAVARPIHLLFLWTDQAEPTVAHPRVLVVLEDGASASVAETFAGGTGQYLTNTVTELVLGEGSRLEHCKLNQEGADAYHIGATQAQLGRAANLVSCVATLGGAITRNDLNVVLGGEGAEATLNGLSILGAKQHADNHTLLDHAKPNCPSHELYKHVLGDSASGVFKGKILVRPGSQKTDARQTSRTLLLSDAAQMNSQPALEIYADDVKCTHGSTTGPVDEEQVFYLRSRGVSLEAARHLLTYAFAAEVTGRIGIEPARRRLEQFMAARHDLPEDLRIAHLD